MFRIVLILSADKDNIHFLRHLLKYLHKQHPFKSIGFDIKAIQSCQNILLVVVVPLFVVVDSIGYFWFSKVILAKLEKVEIGA